jgi:hypothetical protein
MRSSNLFGSRKFSSDSREVSVYLWGLIGSLLPFLSMALAGVLLLRFSRALAPRLVGEDKPLGISGAMTAGDVQAVGFSIVAVLIFLRAILPLSGAIGTWLFAASRDYSERWMSGMVRDAWQNGLSAGIQLVLAIALFLQARGLANLWHHIQIGRYVRIDNTRQDNVRQPHQQ